MGEIRFIDVVTYFRGEPQQIDALQYLQTAVPPEVKEEFSRRYRAKNTIVSKLPVPGVNLIKEFEGCKLKAYYDPLTGGLPITIGWGSTRRRDGSCFMIGNTITQQEADDLLNYQLEKDYLPSLQKIPYWNEMNENQQGALLSFAYNLGAAFYGSSDFKTITAALKNKEWSKVPNALYLYRNPGTNVEIGLARRRKAEGDLWSKQ